tara:strand:- start:1376 stop:3310 length:1935 start_codon:yes stop_codon:yes gene_type:complete
MIKNIFKFSIIFIFFIIEVIAEEIPVIVISPGKTPQSLSTVGSSVDIITNEEIEENSYYSIANIIDDNSTSTNLFQMGGYGSNTGIQIRGIEKRYSTVFIDGVKMLDPSSPDGSFYLEHVMKNGIDRIEVLKGTQSSLYGSNAIGGAINIFTKKGREGKHNNFYVDTGSNNKKSITYSVDGDNGKFNYFLSGNNFSTDGISSMNDNDEKDEYKNDNFIGNLGYKFNDNFQIINSFRLADLFYEYDEVNKSTNDNGTNTKNLEGSMSTKLIHEDGKFKNTFSYNKLHIERNTVSNYSSKQNYFGNRDTFGYLGEYRFNLDNKIVYGIDHETDGARYRQSWGTREVEYDESIFSQYFDLQFRPIEKLYSTFGLRNDQHTTSGTKQSGRATFAYKLNNNSTIRSTLGTGVRFPALFDYRYGSSTVQTKGGKLETLVAERGNSFDLGFDTVIDDLNLDLKVTYFKTEQKNSLLSEARTGWVMRNGTSVNTSEGIELESLWSPIGNKYNVGFNYTFTDSYDANTCDQDHLDAWSDNECRLTGSSVAKAKVRVPRHAVSAKIGYLVNPNFKTVLRASYTGETRDFGNTNDSWTDQILTDYFVFDVGGSYKLFNNYNLTFGLDNILDEEYQQAHEYSTLGRTFNFGIKKIY